MGPCMESNDGEDGTRFMSRRNALKALGAGAASLAAIGPASASPPPHSVKPGGAPASDGGEKGKPHVSASIDCDGLRLERSPNGPQEDITIEVTLTDTTGRDAGETRTFEVEIGPGETIITNGGGSGERVDVLSLHPSVAVSPSTLNSPQCI